MLANVVVTPTPAPLALLLLRALPRCDEINWKGRVGYNDTQWNSHYIILMGFSKMHPAVVQVLEHVKVDGSDAYKRNQSNGLL